MQSECQKPQLAFSLMLGYDLMLRPEIARTDFEVVEGFYVSFPFPASLSHNCNSVLRSCSQDFSDFFCIKSIIYQEALF